MTNWIDDHYERRPDFLSRRPMPSLPAGGANLISQAERQLQPHGRLQFRKDIEDVLRPVLCPDIEAVERAITIAFNRARRRGDL